MTNTEPREAWVEIPSAEQRLVKAREGSRYNFGFAPAMGGLLAAHPRIGPLFGALFGEIMFAPEGELNRAEREMTAAVAAAAQDCFY